MSYTPNLRLELPAYRSAGWHTKLNNNFSRIDSGFGDIQSAVLDIPEAYRFSGMLSSSGTQHDLPKPVSATNEYVVHITLLSDPGDDAGRIYITKTTTSFTITDVENHTTTAYEATLYYVTETNVYGASWHRRWFVSPDASITDHADASDPGSLAWVLCQIDTSPATVELPGNKTYTITSPAKTLNNMNLTFTGTPTNTITRDDGGSFLTDGFLAGMGFSVTGSANNDGHYTIDTVSATEIKTNEDLTTEAEGETVTLYWEVQDNVVLAFQRGAILSDNGGSADLTINGPFQAGPWQIFAWTGSGDIAFGRGVVEIYYAEWWGIDGVDDHTEINLAISAANAAGGGIVQLLAKTYDVTSIVLKTFVTLQGIGKGNTATTGTTLDCKNSTDSVVATEATPPTEEVGHAKVLDLQIKDGKYGIDIANGAFECEFKNIYIEGTATAGIYLGGATRYKIANTFENIHPKNCGYAIDGGDSPGGGKLNSNRFIRIRETGCSSGTRLVFGGESRAYSNSFHQCDFNTGKMVLGGPTYNFGFFNCYFEGATTDTGVELKDTSGVSFVNCYFFAFLKAIVIGDTGQSLSVELFSPIFAAGANDQYGIWGSSSNAYGVLVTNLTTIVGGYTGYVAVWDPSNTVIKVSSNPQRISIGKQDIYMRGGNPEGNITAEPGSLYCRDDGNIYRKRTGSSNTGWQIMHPHGETAKGSDATGTNVFSAGSGTLGPNVGFLSFRNTSGIQVYVPYWINITP